MDRDPESVFSCLSTKWQGGYQHLDVVQSADPFELMPSLTPQQKDLIRSRLVTMERKRVQELNLIRRYSQVRESAGALERRGRNSIIQSKMYPEAQYKLI